MDKSLVIFQEKDLYFGIFPNEFKHHFSLNQVWISHSGDSSPIWHFEKKKDHLQGKFIHFGSLLGLSQAYFNNGGHIFMKETSADSNLGICVNGLLMRIPLQQLPNKKLEIDEFSHFPPDIPKTIFSYIQLYKGKYILVIDPQLLFRAYEIYS